MAKIEIYRSQTPGRALPQGGPLNLQAPDQGIVGRAVAQFGGVLGDVAEVRAELAASSRAATAHSSYQNEMLKVERTARRMKPEDAEAYYLQHSKNEYDKANNSLSSSYSKALFAKPAGKSAYRSRANFYKEHDARLVSAAIAVGDVKAAGHAGLAADPKADIVERWKAMNDGAGELRALHDGGFIDLEDAVKRQRAWAGSTLETTLRAHMRESKNPVALVDSFKDGKLDDPVADALAEMVGDDELIKIKIRMEKAAHRIETGRRQKETAAAKAITADNKQLLSDLYGVDKKMQGGAAAALLQAQHAYKSLIAGGGFGSKAAIENAHEWLGSLGDPRFQEAADAVPYRDADKGSAQASVDRLWLAERDNKLTQAMVTKEKAGLTAADYKSWKGKVEVEREKGIADAIKLFDARFKFTRNMNQGDTLETEQSKAAYYKSVEELRDWNRLNSGVTYLQTMEKGQAIMKARTVELQGELREEFLMALNFSKNWKVFTAPVTGKSKFAGTTNALIRAQVYVAQGGKRDDVGMRSAKNAINQMKQWSLFGVDLTMPVGP